MNKKSRIKIIAFTFLLAILLTATATLATAQKPYTSEVVTTIEIASSGSFTATTSNGVAYEITGTPGSTGRVTTTVYNGNPQATADIPDDIALTKFIVVEFDFDSEDFMQATLTFSYTDADVTGIQEPFAIYKYIPETNSYVQMEGTADTTAKTITITLNSTQDPLFAIGGSSTIAVTNDSSTIWIALAVAVIIIVIIVFLVIRKYQQ